MNILIVPSWHPTEENPGNGVFFLNQAAALKQAGHQVTFLCPHYTSPGELLTSRRAWIKEYEQLGVHMVVYARPSWGANKLGLVCQRAAGMMKDALRYASQKYGPFDLIHAHSFMGAGYGVCRNRDVLNVPIVVTEHLSLIGQNRLTKRQIRNLRETVGSSDSFLAVSGKLKKDIEERTGIAGKIQVVPNMVSDVFRYTPETEKMNSFTFVSVGSLIPDKGHEVTIQAFCDAFPPEAGVQLLICGEGPRKKYLEALIAERHRTHQIQLLGQKNQQELSVIMARSHVFVLASRHETFGVVYIEAMACGLPVIGTKNGGSDEVLAAYGAAAVDIGSQKQLSEAMTAVYREYKRFDHGRISREIRKMYSQEAVVRQLEAVYCEAIKKQL